MQLSEAIRIGATLKPQAFGVTRSADETSTCALGAALEAIGVRGSYSRAFIYFPIARTDAGHPVSQQDELVLSIVRDLNDNYRWTREQIADWVASVEAAQALAQPASTDAIDPSAADPGTLPPRAASSSPSSSSPSN